MFAEVVRAGSEIDNLGAIRNGGTAFVGHARWLDHLNVGFRITAMKSKFLVYDDDATLDATVDEMEILVSSFWHSEHAYQYQSCSHRQPLPRRSGG